MDRVSTSAEKMQSQSYFDILASLSENWQMKFDVDKCKVLHIENKNQYTKYTMYGSKLFKVSQVKN